MVTVVKQIIRDFAPPILRRNLQKLRPESTGRDGTDLMHEISIDRCVHYCGFRYGVGDYNPYESYLIDLQEQVPVSVARRGFIEFLSHYRPLHMGQALGSDGLSKEYPLWLYPWQHFDPSSYNLRRGWCATPNSCPDIMTHFCESGILLLRVEEEFVWLERALNSIYENGYQPEQQNDYISTRQFCRLDGESRYLLMDGNHRVSAMSALGFKAVTVHQKPTDIVYEKDSDSWYGVRHGFYSRDDALRIFHAYFEGNKNYRTTEKPAPIIGPDQWELMYEG